jgi:hypothetical protein
MEKPPVVAARKFVEEELFMTFSMGDSQSKSLEDIKSLCVASYPVPGKDHEQVHNNPGWMKMEGNTTMWIMLNAILCMEMSTTALCSNRINQQVFGLHSVFGVGDVTASSGFQLYQA